ncbi:hypothetical protein O988_07328 [Pseudogymnoascus sp. VKM F-3808]|nr:hypothetical protein O988_07328 [Pseudogymnoascus sp. VKM F-3808]
MTWLPLSEKPYVEDAQPVLGVTEKMTEFTSRLPTSSICALPLYRHGLSNDPPKESLSKLIEGQVRSVPKEKLPIVTQICSHVWPYGPSICAFTIYQYAAMIKTDPKKEKLSLECIDTLIKGMVWQDHERDDYEVNVLSRDWTYVQFNLFPYSLSDDGNSSEAGSYKCPTNEDNKQGHSTAIVGSNEHVFKAQNSTAKAARRRRVSKRTPPIQILGKRSRRKELDEAQREINAAGIEKYCSVLEFT